MKIRKFVHESPLVGIMAAQLQLNRVLVKRFSAIDLSYLEAMVLVTIFFEGNRKIGPSEIARSLFYPLPRVSTAISNLQSNGLITRALLDDDSRKYSIALSSKGKNKASKAVGIFDSLQGSIEESLGTSLSSQLNQGLLTLRRLWLGKTSSML